MFTLSGSIGSGSVSTFLLSSQGLGSIERVPKNVVSPGFVVSELAASILGSKLKAHPPPP